MKRKTYILMGIFVLLLIIAFLVMQKPGEQSASTSGAGHLLTLDSLAVDKIDIKSPPTDVVLEKKGVEWFVEKPIVYRADQSNVTSLIQQAKNFEVKGVVSNNPGKQSVYQVDSTGTEVTIYEQGKEKASFVVGKMGSSFAETYVRMKNSNDVVLVGGVFGYMFNRSVKDWRDKTIFSVPKESIREVKFQYGDTTFTLAFRDSAWMIGQDSTQDYAVNSLLTSLSNLRADDFLDSLSASTSSPKIGVVISYGGGQVRFAEVKGERKYQVQSSASPQWYEMQSWNADQVFKRKKDLLKSGK